MAEFFEVAEVASLAPGSGRSIQVRGKRLALFNVGGTFYVIEDDCPHRGGPLGGGWFEGCVVHCPMHGWGFNVTTGACDVRPDRPVKTFPVEVREGKVWLGLVAREPKNSGSAVNTETVDCHHS